MTKLLTTTFIAAAAIALGSPAFAETYANEMGTGDIHPIVNQHSFAQQSFAASTYEAPRYVASSRRSGLHSYAMVGQRWTNSNDPSRTGGGSIGYNASLYNY
jgi:hypothetical protein